MRHTGIGFLLLFLSTGESIAQFRPVDPRLTHYRVVAVVPVVGAGTKESPKRPLLADLPGLIAWQAEPSDNRQFCLVELVAKSPAVLEAAFTNAAWQQAAQNRPGLPPGIQLLMQRKEDSRVREVYAEFAKLKRSFRAEAFGVAVP